MTFTGEPVTGKTVFNLLDEPSDQQAWDHFVERYAPLIYHWARLQGLQDASCHDVCQDVLIKLFRNLKSYDRSVGSFRGWLRTIVRRCCADAYRAAGRHVGGTGDPDMREMLAAVEDPHGDPIEDLIHAMDAEYEQSLRKRALDIVQARVDAISWQAFWRVRFREEDPKAVAAELGKTVGSVYMACHRLGRMAADELDRLKGTPREPGT
jgi:RNA polymerase sigma factor (sigma-70 family)